MAGPNGQPGVSPPARRPRRRIRRRYHFGPGGYLYIFVTLLVALGAFNSQNNLLYWTFGFALALLLVSGVISGAMLMGVRVEREWVSGATVGDPLRIRYRVRNVNRLVPAFALTIQEVGFDQAAPARRSLLERLLRRSARTVSRPPLFGPPLAFVAHVGAREAVHAEASVITLRRGAASFTAIRVHTGFPFGLMRKSLLIPQHGATVITPDPLPPDSEALLHGVDAAASGSQSLRTGRGDEFFSLREYAPGDSPRAVAWRASAKRGSLLVRQHAAPAPDRVWIVLHLRPRPGSASADERAIRIAAGLAAQAEADGAEYGLAVPLTRLLVPPRRGPGHLRRLMTDLGLLELGPDDGRGARSVCPPQATGRAASCIVVHAGAFDAGFAPAAQGVTNLVASEDAGAPRPRPIAAQPARPRRRGVSRAR